MPQANTHTHTPLPVQDHLSSHSEVYLRHQDCGCAAQPLIHGGRDVTGGGIALENVARMRISADRVTGYGDLFP